MIPPPITLSVIGCNSVNRPFDKQTSLHHFNTGSACVGLNVQIKMAISLGHFKHEYIFIYE